MEAAPRSQERDLHEEALARRRTLDGALAHYGVAEVVRVSRERLSPLEASADSAQNDATLDSIAQILDQSKTGGFDDSLVERAQASGVPPSRTGIDTLSSSILSTGAFSDESFSRVIRGLIQIEQRRASAPVEALPDVPIFLYSTPVDPSYETVASVDDAPKNPEYRSVMALIDRLPDERFASMYKDDQSEGGQVLRELLTHTMTNEPAAWVSSSVKRLEKVHQMNAMMFESEGVGDTDEAAKALLGRSDMRDIMASTLYAAGKDVDLSTYESMSQYNNELMKWTMQYVHRTLGVSRESTTQWMDSTMLQMRAHDYKSSDASARLDYVTHTEIKPMIDAVRRNVEAVGPELLDRVRERAGLVNIDYFTPAQLERMDKLTQGDEALLEHLRQGDVTMVMIDGKGDHNGAMRSAPEHFEKDSGRTLYFQIQQPSDLIRYSVMLRSRGILSSTMVIAAHGSPESMKFGRGEGSFTVTGSEEVASKRKDSIAIENAPFIQRIATECMQPSRSIDDDESQRGKVTLILQSCSQAVSIDGRPSTAEVIMGSVAQGVNGQVFAAEGVSVASFNDVGVYTMSDHADKNRASITNRFTKEGDGSVAMNHVDGVSLRRAS